MRPNLVTQAPSKALTTLLVSKFGYPRLFRNRNRHSSIIKNTKSEKNPKITTGANAVTSTVIYVVIN
jgi:hemerythrin